MPPVGFKPTISAGERPQAAHLLKSWVRIPPGAWIFVCCECRVLSGRGLCDEPVTRPEESYRLCCVVVCDLETSRIGAPYIYDISNLRVKEIQFLPSNLTRAGWSLYKIKYLELQGSPSSVVSIVNRLRTGQSGVYIPVGVRYSSLL